MSDDPPPSIVPGRYRSVADARRARRRLAATLAPVLDELVASRDAASDLRDDPLGAVHRYDDIADQEVVGLIASSLAYGSVPVILDSVRRVLDVLGPHPADVVANRDPSALEAALDAFVHRWTRGSDVARLLVGAGAALRRHQTLGRCFETALADHGSLRPALSAFGRDIVGENCPRSLAFLMPDAARGGACKRLLLFLRWMVRGPDGVDLGLWDVPASSLLMPLDTHTTRLCRDLGLTRRADASWRTVEEVTWALRGLDPDDPVKIEMKLRLAGRE